MITCPCQNLFPHNLKSLSAKPLLYVPWSLPFNSIKTFTHPNLSYHYRPQSKVCSIPKSHISVYLQHYKHLGTPSFVPSPQAQAHNILYHGLKMESFATPYHPDMSHILPDSQLIDYVDFPVVPFPFIDTPPLYQPLPLAPPVQPHQQPLHILVDTLSLPLVAVKGKGKAHQPSSHKSTLHSQTSKKSRLLRRGGKRKAEDKVDSFLSFLKKLVIEPHHHPETDPIISIIHHSQQI